MTATATRATGSLFALTGDALRLQNRINEAAEQLFSDDPAEVAVATAELEALIDAEAGNRKAVEAKADAWCWVIESLRARAAAQTEHAKRLTALAKEAEHQADVLQDRLVTALQRIDPDATSYKLPEHKITSRKSTAVELDPDLDPEDLPGDLQRTKIEADKAAIKTKIEASIAAAVAAAGPDEEAAAKARAVAIVSAVPGASLVERRSWKIS